MLDYLQGRLIEIDRQTITIQLFGIGLKLFFPASDIASLPSLGNEVEAFTALFVKDTSFELYGFLKKETRNVFYQLTQISGIGPKTALHVLSAMSVTELYQNIDASDDVAIAKIPGIGKKTAQRLIVDMKGTIPKTPSKSLHMQDALLALKKLGFSEHLARKALDRAYHENQVAKVDELITLSLKHLS